MIFEMLEKVRAEKGLSMQHFASICLGVQLSTYKSWKEKDICTLNIKSQERIAENLDMTLNELRMMANCKPLEVQQTGS